MKTVLALLVGGVIGFTLAKDRDVSDWVVKQATAVKKQVHEWTR